MYDFVDETSVQTGTPINRQALMAIQGFIGQNITFNADGSITETNALGQTKTTTFNDDGSITETFTGDLTISKTIIFNSNGSISEVIS